MNSKLNKSGFQKSGNPEIAGLFSLDCKQSACNAGDPHSIPGSGRSPEVENGNPLQHSCLDNSMDRGALWATDQGQRENTYAWETACVQCMFLMRT